MHRLFLVFALALLFPLFANEPTCIDLAQHEFKIYSQNGEDGVIDKIFDCIGATSKYYVEFGTENGVECNTRYLRENGWCGLLMDGNWDIPVINLHKEFITAENIAGLFAKYQVPEEFDLLSIDIDFNDFYIWHALGNKYKPRVIVVEYNAFHPPQEDKIVKYQSDQMWDGTNYFGGSILAFYQLGRSLGYSLVYANKNGVNLFFVRDDVLEASNITFMHTNDVEAIYNPSRYGCGPNGGHRQDPHMREYICSKDVLE